MRIQISADGKAGTRIFCVKCTILLSQKTDVNTNHMTKYICHDNVHSIRHSALKTYFRFNASVPQAPLLQPDQTELAYTHAMHRHPSLKSREERGGGVDIYITTI